ncbi:DALR anticodon-binding domain-containing protein, partial [Brucella oryzae]
RAVVDEVGRGPVRFMMLYRKHDAPLDFEFDKVTEQSNDTPVFYEQYASARPHSDFRQAIDQLGLAHLDRVSMAAHFDKLTDESEIALVRKLAEYPRLIEAAAIHQEPH